MTFVEINAKCKLQILGRYGPLIKVVERTSYSKYNHFYQLLLILQLFIKIKITKNWNFLRFLFGYEDFLNCLNRFWINMLRLIELVIWDMAKFVQCPCRKPFFFHFPIISFVYIKYVKMSIWQYHSLMKCSVPLPKPSQIDFTQILIYI